MSNSEMSALSINSEDAFLQHIFLALFKDMSCTISDSERERRFGEENPADPETSAAFLGWVVANSQRLFQAFSRYSDQHSKRLFIDILRYKLVGASHMRLPIETQAYWILWDQMYRAVSVDTESQQRYPDRIQTNSFKFWQFPFQGRTIKLLCLFGCVFDGFYMNQYFYNHEKISIQPEPGEYVVDAGGFVGETAIQFAIAVAPHGRVFSFELVHEHIEIMKHNFRANALENIVVFPYGLSDTHHEAPPLLTDSVNGSFKVGSGTVPLITLDELVQNGAIERVDFIKMDVEGSELSALAGARSTIQRFKPKLAISAYHKNEDMYSIAEWILGLNLGYRLFLENYHYRSRETVIYAMVMS